MTQVDAAAATERWLDGHADELAPGRVVLGFGTGHTGRRVMGLPPVKHAVFREEVRLIHELLRDGRSQPARAAPGTAGEGNARVPARARKKPGRHATAYSGHRER